MSIKKLLSEHKNDIILAVSILGLSAVCFAIFLLTMKNGKYVSVSVDGREVFKESINATIEKTITTGADGAEENVLVISDGKAYVKSATCPDKICVGHRKISKTGESIVCLPHKVVVSITE